MSQSPGSPGSPVVPPPPPIGGAKVVVAALGLGLLAVIILSVYIQNVKDQVAAEQFTVFVLTKKVRVGDSINRKDWVGIPVPKRDVFVKGFGDLGAIVSMNGRDDELQANITGGKKWEVNAPDGSIVTYAFFTKQLDRTELDIDEGCVRVALPIKSKGTPGGLRPGMRVDIAAPMTTGGQIPEVKKVMHHMVVKSVGTFTLAEEGAGENTKQIRSYNSISIDVTPEIATQLSTLEKMVKAIGEFEIYIAPQTEREQPWSGKLGTINPEVMELIRKHLPGKLP